MKKLLLLTVLAGTVMAQAQTKYVDDVHTRASVQKTSNIFYARGMSVLTGTPVMDSMRMDVYVSSENTDAKKPLIIYCHTGSFLPRYVNGLATGARDDSATVEMCNRFAQKGYVVAAISYRQGWNPLAPSEDDRKNTIINAAYRGVQDLSAAVRYFKRDAATTNTWKIDSTKIAVGGQGTGGYITSAFATLNSQAEIKIDKFTDFNTNKYMVNDTLWGDRMGLPINAGSVLAPNNWPGYTSNAAIAFNVGGALGDTSWLNAGDVPLICAHGIYDPFAPYKTGYVSVPGTSLKVVEVSGGYDIMARANALNTISSYKGKVYDRFTHRANQLNNGNEGLFPFDGVANGSGPWEWWDSARIRLILTLSGKFTQKQIDDINKNSSLSNPLMSKARALKYIDTLQGYIAPRLAVSMGLVASVGISKVNYSNQVNIYPVPAQNMVTISNNASQPMQAITITDINGRVIYTATNPSNYLNIPLSVPTGVYFANIQFADGTATKKIVKQ